MNPVLKPLCRGKENYLRGGLYGTLGSHAASYIVRPTGFDSSDGDLFFPKSLIPEV